MQTTKPGMATSAVALALGGGGNRNILRDVSKTG